MAIIVKSADGWVDGWMDGWIRMFWIKTNMEGEGFGVRIDATIMYGYPE
jgi:hypothetical protein